MSKRTKERVLAAARELDYHINVNARSLTSGKTYTLALVLPDVTNPFFPAVARGVEDYASENGYCVILCNTDGNSRKESDYIAMLRSRKVDGVIFAISAPSKSRINTLLDDGIAVVLVDRDLGDTYDIVKTDNVSGAILAKSSHRSGAQPIAFHYKPMKFYTLKRCLRGYSDALLRHDIPFDEDLVMEGDFRMESGYEATKRLLKKFKNVGETDLPPFCSKRLDGVRSNSSLRRVVSMFPDVAVMDTTILILLS